MACYGIRKLHLVSIKHGLLQSSFYAGSAISDRVHHLAPATVVSASIKLVSLARRLGWYRSAPAVVW
jgi:hypothetical protein